MFPKLRNTSETVGSLERPEDVIFFGVLFNERSGNPITNSDLLNCLRRKLATQ